MGKNFFLKILIAFSFFPMLLYPEEGRDLKKIFSEHYLNLYYFSEEMINYRYTLLINNLKNGIFCDVFEEGDELNEIKRMELWDKKFFYENEKLLRKAKKGKEEYKYGVGFGNSLITIPSNYVPEDEYNKVFIIKKKNFFNCDAKGLDKLELSKKICTEFDFEYYIFSRNEKIKDEFCFKLFSFYDEHGRGSIYYPKRKIKFFGTLIE